ncbi:ABC transporter substrate-binding protein [Anoxybacillus rupiensis]|uniref:ABC transporter substrate-binding protein n=1 Tax=Anoxybacteroides rupiense TaxID=311460 RepID=A0ABT5W8T5_9BACL|nr:MULTISPECIES: ABC transporter substrate-binding protein [Anoxybacillus]MBB3908795.1 ABC-type glycerol-3-phosphate transport system substrate-binding protein [Anoxybacillus rupiensis]MDE8565748.1 ABC transporter substrate-binding protein [Anoxybacillus rupiensis]QHC02746.1 extracellular solute-binding protein [Anoxybacillus sp. PDR2]
MKKSSIYLIITFTFLLLISIFLFNKQIFNDKTNNGINVIKVLSLHKLTEEAEEAYTDNIKQIYPDYNISFDAVLDQQNDIRNEQELINRIKEKLKDDTYHIIVEIDEDLAFSLSKEGLLRNIHSSIKPLIKRYSILSNYSESVPGNNPGETYFIPIDFRGYCLIYNRDIFKRLNIKEPSQTEDWDNIYKLSEMIEKKSNGAITPLTYGSNFPPLAFNEFLKYIAPLEIYLDSSGSSQKRLKDEWVKFIDNYKHYSMNVYDGAEFLRGNIAMEWVDTSTLFDDLLKQMEQGNLLGAKKFRYNVVSSPRFEGHSFYGMVDNVAVVPYNTPNYNISTGLINMFYTDHFVNSAYTSESVNLPIHITKKLEDIYNQKDYKLDIFYPEKLKFSYTNYGNKIIFPGITLMYDSIRGNISPEDSLVEFQKVIKDN